MLRTILITGSLAFLMGCASNSTQQTTLLLVDQLDNYQNQVRAKIKAETNFYTEIQSTAEEAAVLHAWQDQNNTELNKIIQLTDQAIVQDKGMQVSILQEFLREQNRLAATRMQNLENQRVKLEKSYQVSFNSLAFKINQLNKLRTQLLDLAQDRDNRLFLIEQIQEAAKLALELQNCVEQKQNTKLC